MSESELEAVRFRVEGMTCSSCVSRITRYVRRVNGVRGVHVDLVAERVTVRRIAGTACVADLGAAVESAGYHVDLASAVAAEVTAGRTLLERLLRR